MPSRWRVVFVNKKLGTKFTTTVDAEPSLDVNKIAEAAVAKLSEHLKRMGVGSLNDYRTFSVKQEGDE